MYKLWTVMLVFAVACVIGISGLYAGEAPPKEKPKFDLKELITKLDTNKNGVLSLSELMASERLARDKDALTKAYEKAPKVKGTDTPPTEGVNEEGFRALMKELRGGRGPGGKGGTGKRPGGKRPGGEKPAT
jgi:hypothetical protein